MADIKKWGIGGGNGIEGMTSTDPFFYEVENRPLINLTDNDNLINNEISSLIYKYPIETPNGIINTFTLPNGESAIENSLQVFLNGLLYNPKNITLKNAQTQFEIADGENLPESTDDFYFIYRIKQTNPKYYTIDAFNLVENTGLQIIENVATGDGTEKDFYTTDYVPSGGIINGTVPINYENAIYNSVKFFAIFGTGPNDTETFVNASGEIADDTNKEINLESNFGGTGKYNYETGEFELLFNYPPLNNEKIKIYFEKET